ncbi:DUF2231 domain-containing protein [Mesorhizobium opportunistum]|nr:DUF2231 domain-containing protein [Mesorhizobium opportunistum]
MTVSKHASQAAAIADHRNWAIITAVIWWLIAIWEIWRSRRPAQFKVVFALVVVLALLPLGTTGWKGGEVVYRHGVGVLTANSR